MMMIIIIIIISYVSLHEAKSSDYDYFLIYIYFVKMCSCFKQYYIYFTLIKCNSHSRINGLTLQLE